MKGKGSHLQGEKNQDRQTEESRRPDGQMDLEHGGHRDFGEGDDQRVWPDDVREHSTALVSRK